MTQRATIEYLAAILDMYPLDHVRVAVKRRVKRERGIDAADGEWKVWRGAGKPPKPFEFRTVGDRIEYREPAKPDPKSAGSVSVNVRSTAPRQRTDTALKENPGMSCPFCGEAKTYREPVCPACREGKAGMAARIICGDNSDHVFYVTRGV